MLLSVLSGGMNSLRVWGGGTFLPTLFYEICGACSFHVGTASHHAESIQSIHRSVCSR
eukprot:SAG31_NODE_948_length_10825_cov_9.412829_15_plen_58_part_00